MCFLMRPYHKPVVQNILSIYVLLMTVLFSPFMLFLDIESYQSTPPHQAHSIIIDVGDAAQSYLLIVPDSALPTLLSGVFSSRNLSIYISTRGSCEARVLLAILLELLP